MGWRLGREEGAQNPGSTEPLILDMCVLMSAIQVHTDSLLSEMVLQTYIGVFIFARFAQISQAGLAIYTRR